MHANRKPGCEYCEMAHNVINLSVLNRDLYSTSLKQASSTTTCGFKTLEPSMGAHSFVNLKLVWKLKLPFKFNY